MGCGASNQYGEEPCFLLDPEPATGQFITVEYLSQNKLVVECEGDLPTTNTVTRGAEVTCAARKDPVNAPGALTISGWSFDGQPRTDGDLTSATWKGVMVKGGTVEVKGTIGGGTEQTARATVQVKDRTWSVAFTVKQVGNGDDDRLTLNSAIRWAHDLGGANFFTTPSRSASSPEVTEVVDGGPNHEFRYFTDLSFPVYAHYVLNHAAMSRGSAFYLAQEEERPGGGTRLGGTNWCDRSVITSSLPRLVEAHELRHIEVYKEVFFQELQPVLQRLEPMTGPDAGELIDAYEEAFAEVQKTAHEASDAIHKIPNAGNPNLVKPRDSQGECLLRNQIGGELKNKEPN
jgi:hypothetical protein